MTTGNSKSVANNNPVALQLPALFKVIADPEGKYTVNGRFVTKIKAVFNRFTPVVGGEMKDESYFFNINVWGDTGMWANENVLKGDTILVEGRYVIRAYQTNDGEDRTSREIAANSIAVLARKMAEGEQAPAQTEQTAEVEQGSFPF